MLDLSLNITILVIMGLAILLAVFLFARMAGKMNKASLLKPTDTQPDWMRNSPPKETVVATLAKGEGVQLYEDDEEEALASPFAEQIEDILQAKLAANPELQQYKIDLGTAVDGRLEISINGVIYASIEDIPNEKLKALFNQAIEDWGKV